MAENALPRSLIFCSWRRDYRPPGQDLLGQMAPGDSLATTVPTSVQFEFNPVGRAG